MTVGQARFDPYWGMAQQTYGMRAPVYHAEPIHGEAAAWAFPIGGGATDTSWGICWAKEPAL